MSKCLCVNLNKGEYFDFGEFEKNNYEGSPACSTLEYFLATEWKEDNILFVFEGNYLSEFFPEEENVYEFITFNYLERNVLNKSPKYSFVANTLINEYYFKAALPESEDGPYICPLPFILSEKNSTEYMGIRLNSKEEANVGRWLNCSIVATNNKDFCKGFTLFESPYVKESQVSKNLAGLNVVVSGTITGFSRYGVEKLIKEHGGNTQSGVTKKTDILVVGYKPGTKKLENASKYGTRIIYEKEFFEMLEED